MGAAERLRDTLWVSAARRMGKGVLFHVLDHAQLSYFIQQVATGTDAALISDSQGGHRIPPTRWRTIDISRRRPAPPRVE